MFCPPKTMLPLLGVSNPANIRSKVDLPQPELPSRAKISPFLMDRETSFTAVKSPKRFIRFCVCRKPSGAAGAAAAKFMAGLSGGSIFEDLLHFKLSSLYKLPLIYLQ